MGPNICADTPKMNHQEHGRRLSPVKEELFGRCLEAHNPIKDDDESESDEEDVRDLSDSVASRVCAHIVHVGRLGSKHGFKVGRRHARNEFRTYRSSQKYEGTYTCF